MNDVLKKLNELGLIPVIKIDDALSAVPLAKALIDGGLPVAEITFRTEAAEEAIRNISAQVPEILVGAGTVLTVEQAERAINAGAKYIVSPGINPKVVEYCINRGVPITPGCSNPTDIELALSYGLEVVKFFPAESFGGLATIKAVGAVYGSVSYIPTGGISAENLNEYLSYNKIFACGGSWMVKNDLIKEGRFDEITKLVREAVYCMLGFELAHIGINAKNEDDSMSIAQQYSKVFNFPLKPGNSSNFAGTGIEVNKIIGLGRNGHIAIKTNSIQRAIAYLEKSGVEVDMNTVKKGTDGSMAAVYLKNEIGGFAVHLLQKK